MYTKQQLQEIVNYLSDLSKNDLTQAEIRELTISDTYKSKIERLGVEITSGKDNTIIINLDQSDFYIRKNKKDFLKTCGGHIAEKKLEFKKSILLIEEKLIYLKDDADNNLSFFQNVLSSFELLDIFKKYVADFDDYANSKLILLSPTKGKLELTYEDAHRYKAKSFFEDEKNNFQQIVDSLKEKIRINPDFPDFVKDSFIENNKNCFFDALSDIDNILITAKRNHELHIKKFDFKEFEKGLSESKQDFFKSYTKFQSEILSKINALPIQFGIYIYLLNKFSDALYPLIATLLLIIIWGGFYIRTLQNLQDDLIDLEKDFDTTFARIMQQSGISSDDVDAYKKQIKNSSKKQIKRIYIYKWLNICLLVFLLGVSCYLAYELISADTLKAKK